MSLIVGARAAVLLLFAVLALTPAPLSIADELRDFRPRAILGWSASVHPSQARPSQEHRADAVLPPTSSTAGLLDGLEDAEASLRAGPATQSEVLSEAGPAHEPSHLRIAAIDVDTRVVPVGLTPWGAMEAPELPEDVGWFTYGATPGAEGRAVLAGHRDSPAGSAIFFELDRLAVGDIIEVFARDGTVRHTFVVYDTHEYPLGDAPLDQIFGSNGSADLALITCTGDFSSERGYSHRVVVYARLVRE